MSAGSLDGNGTRTTGTAPSDLVPREYLRAIAVWSLIPAYLFAGAFFGYLADRAMGTFPFAMGGGLLLALGLAVRDMMRLRNEFGLGPR